MIGSAVAGLYMQQQQADAQGEMNQRQAKNILEARAANANAVSLEQTQQHDLASQKMNANDVALREAQATEIAGAGPGGMSVDALLGDMGAKGAKYNSSVEQNLASTQMALSNQLVNVNNNAASQMNQLKTPAQPDYLGTSLKIGGAAYGAYTKPDAPTSNWDANYSHEGRNG